MAKSPARTVKAISMQREREFLETSGNIAMGSSVNIVKPVIGESKRCDRRVSTINHSGFLGEIYRILSWWPQLVGFGAKGSIANKQHGGMDLISRGQFSNREDIRWYG